MMGFGGLLWYLVMAALLIIPLYRLLPKFGINRNIAFFAVIPAVAVVLLWIMAFKDDVQGT